MPPRTPASQPKLPTKWLLAIIGVLLLYGLAQPTLNARFGWNLPSVAGLLGDGQGKAVTERDSKSSKAAAPSASTPAEKREAKSGAKQPATDQKDAAQGKVENEGARAESVEEYLHESAPGSEDFLSPGGLRYTRGSEEGHRLKHLAKHLEDQPSRTGKHGVFEGDLLQVLRWLDDGYERAQRGAAGTSQKTEDRRTVYEVTFDQAIGYVGGRDGKRNGNPSAKRLRIVVEGNRVITAFPF